MKRLFLFFLLSAAVHFIYSQTIHPEKLDKEISSLNDQHLYEKSILKLQQILDNPNASHYDRYNAYLQKYLTYKRVSDFTAALENIKAAEKEGKLSDKKEECQSRIAIEDIFVKIELQEFAQVRNMLPEARKKINLKLIDTDTQGFFLCTLGILDIAAKHFPDAENHLNLAEEIFRKHNPKHLANVFRKKIDLYKAMGNETKVINAYKTGLYYAQKYKIDVYEKGLYESMAQYYRENHNPKLVDYYLNLSEKTAITTFKTLNENEKLKNLELKIHAEKDFKKHKNEEKLMAAFALISITISLFAFYFYKKYQVNKKKRIITEQENQKIRNELQLIIQKNQNPENNPASKKNELSSRQLQILELVKKGKTNKEIGTELYISENTVKYHLKIIYNILDVESRLQLQEQNS